MCLETVAEKAESQILGTYYKINVLQTLNVFGNNSRKKWFIELPALAVVVGVLACRWFAVVLRLRRFLWGFGWLGLPVGWD